MAQTGQHTQVNFEVLIPLLYLAVFKTSRATLRELYTGAYFYRRSRRLSPVFRRCSSINNTNHFLRIIKISSFETNTMLRVTNFV